MEKNIVGKNNKKDIDVMRIMRTCIYYLIIFLVSLFSIDRIPIGAISSISAVVAANHIAFPAVILNIIALAIMQPISILIYIVYLVLFTFSSIILKPLVSTENRNEKKKLGNYVIVITALMLLKYYGFFASIGISMIVYAIYKLIVNSLAVVKNEEKRIVFSKIEQMSVIITVMAVIMLIISLAPVISRYAYLLIIPIIAVISVKYGLFESLLISLITYALSIFVGTLNLNIYIMIFTPVLFSLLNIFNKRSVVIILALLNIFMLVIYNDDLFTYSVFAIASILVILRFKDYDILDMFSKIKKISDEGERRLVSNTSTIENVNVNSNYSNDSLEQLDITDEGDKDYDYDYEAINTDEKEIEGVTIYVDIIRSESGKVLDVDILEEDEYIKLKESNEDIENNNNKKDDNEKVHSNKSDENETDKKSDETNESYKKDNVAKKELKKIVIGKEKLDKEIIDTYLMEENINGFKKYFINSDKTDDITIYDEIIYQDNILKDIYEKIVLNDYNELKDEELTKLLEDNNIIIISNYDDDNATNDEKDGNLDYNNINNITLKYILDIRDDVIFSAKKKLVLSKIRRYEEASDIASESITEVYKRM